MTDTLKMLARGALGDSLASLYATPIDKKTIVKNILLCNTDSAARTVTISIEGVAIVSSHEIEANDTLVIPLSTIMESEDALSGEASVDAVVNYYLSGIEVG